MKASGKGIALFLMSGLPSVMALSLGRYQLCRACRTPISSEDMESEHYVPGQSCPHCYGTKTEEQQQRFAERQRQIELAKQRNQVHIGAKYARHQPD